MTNTARLGKPAGLFTRCLLATLTCAALTISTGAQSNTENTQNPDSASSGDIANANRIEELVVTGKRPGPPLWRVSKGSSTLWIFGVIDPLPKGLNWDPASINAIMEDSQAYLSPPGVSASVSNPLRVIGVLRAFSKLKKLPKGQVLSEVVPQDLYDEFRQVADQVGLSQRRTKRLRPMYAAEALIDQALARSGLRDSEQLQEKIHKIAKRHKVHRLDHQRSIDIDSALEILASPALAAELDCLRTTVAAVGTDLQQAKVRAQAWADGNARLLMAMNYPDLNSSCVVGLFSNPQARNLQAAAKQAWLDSAVQLLEADQTSFASLPMRELANADGLLNALKQKGYQVRGQ